VTRGDAAPDAAGDVAGWAAGIARLGRPADVLAGVAQAVGVEWDGPGRAVDLVVPDQLDVPGWSLLDAAREAVLAPADRRRLGAHHTPVALARRLVALALDGCSPTAVVADPACGGGAFLVAAADALVAAGADPATVVARQLVGRDVDPVAVAVTRAALRCWATAAGVDGVAGPAGIVVGDGLVQGWTADVVVGNPPFLSPLGSATPGGRSAAALRRALGAPYADTAWLFLLRSLQAVGPGGRVVLVQPESLLSARDARAVRAAVLPHLEGMWLAGEPVFGAAVRVCAPVLAGGPVRGPVRRWRGVGVRPAGRVARPDASGWARLRPTSAPPVRVGGGPVLGDLAAATAGFRDEFYGLAAAVTDGGPGQPVVTSGLIEPGRSVWGERVARIGGRRFDRPVVDGSRLDHRVAAWVAARSVPKVLVATQTRVVEAAPDHDGSMVPLTPVLSVEPRRGADVWWVAAALTSPLVSAWALHTFGGAALAGDAIKLSARQVLAAPLPRDRVAWSAATRALRRGDVVACGTTLAGADHRLLDWWRSRLPGRP
jgi:hypothetical protein